MNCTICGKSTLLGAMLCAPCKAALKRARYVTVQEDIRRPSVIDVRRQARRAPAVDPVAVEAPSAEADAPPMAPNLGDATANARLARRIFLGVFVLAGILGGASYFGQRELGARSHDTAAATSASDNASPAVPAPPLTTPALAASPVVAPAVSSSAPSASPLVPAGAEASGPPVAAAPNLAATKLLAANPGKRAMVKNATTFATANGDPPDAVPMPEPEKAQPAPAPPPPPPPAPDHWQSMRDAIAQCDREGMIDGIICGQKARIQYCAGYWGKVPQCPGPTVNPER